MEELELLKHYDAYIQNGGNPVDYDGLLADYLIDNNIDSGLKLTDDANVKTEFIEKYGEERLQYLNTMYKEFNSATNLAKYEDLRPDFTVAPMATESSRYYGTLTQSPISPIGEIKFGESDALGYTRKVNTIDEFATKNAKILDFVNPNPNGFIRPAEKDELAPMEMVDSWFNAPERGKIIATYQDIVRLKDSKNIEEQKMGELAAKALQEKKVLPLTPFYNSEGYPYWKVVEDGEDTFGKIQRLNMGDRTVLANGYWEEVGSSLLLDAPLDALRMAVDLGYQLNKLNPINIGYKLNTPKGYLTPSELSYNEFNNWISRRKSINSWENDEGLTSSFTNFSKGVASMVGQVALTFGSGFVGKTATKSLLSLALKEGTSKVAQSIARQQINNTAARVGGRIATGTGMVYAGSATYNEARNLGLSDNAATMMGLIAAGTVKLTEALTGNPARYLFRTSSNPYNPVARVFVNDMANRAKAAGVSIPTYMQKVAGLQNTLNIASNYFNKGEGVKSIIKGTFQEGFQESGEEFIMNISKLGYDVLSGETKYNKKFKDLLEGTRDSFILGGLMGGMMRIPSLFLQKQADKDLTETANQLMVQYAMRGRGDDLRANFDLLLADNAFSKAAKGNVDKEFDKYMHKSFNHDLSRYEKLAAKLSSALSSDKIAEYLNAFTTNPKELKSISEALEFTLFSESFSNEIRRNLEISDFLLNRLKATNTAEFENIKSIEYNGSPDLIRFIANDGKYVVDERLTSLAKAELDTMSDYKKLAEDYRTLQEGINELTTEKGFSMELPAYNAELKKQQDGLKKFEERKEFKDDDTLLKFIQKLAQFDYFASDKGLEQRSQFYYYRYVFDNSAELVKLLPNDFDFIKFLEERHNRKVLDEYIYTSDDFNFNILSRKSEAFLNMLGTVLAKAEAISDLSNIAETTAEQLNTELNSLNDFIKTLKERVGELLASNSINQEELDEIENRINRLQAIEIETDEFPLQLTNIFENNDEFLVEGLNMLNPLFLNKLKALNPISSSIKTWFNTPDISEVSNITVEDFVKAQEEIKEGDAENYDNLERLQAVLHSLHYKYNVGRLSEEVTGDNMGIDQDYYEKNVTALESLIAISKNNRLNLQRFNEEYKNAYIAQSLSYLNDLTGLELEATTLKELIELEEKYRDFAYTIPFFDLLGVDTSEFKELEDEINSKTNIEERKNALRLNESAELEFILLDRNNDIMLWSDATDEQLSQGRIIVRLNVTSFEQFTKPFFNSYYNSDSSATPSEEDLEQHKLLYYLNLQRNNQTEIWNDILDILEEGKPEDVAYPSLEQIMAQKHILHFIGGYQSELFHKDQVTNGLVLRGGAGTGKTNYIMKFLLDYARKKGFSVAYSSAQYDSLKEIKALQGYGNATLMTIEEMMEAEERTLPDLVFIDEHSMIGKSTAELKELMEKHIYTKFILLGDELQSPSTESKTYKVGEKGKSSFVSFIPQVYTDMVIEMTTPILNVFRTSKVDSHQLQSRLRGLLNRMFNLLWANGEGANWDEKIEGFIKEGTVSPLPDDMRTALLMEFDKLKSLSSTFTLNENGLIDEGIRIDNDESVIEQFKAKYNEGEEQAVLIIPRMTKNYDGITIAGVSYSKMDNYRKMGVQSEFNDPSFLKEYYIKKYGLEEYSDSILTSSEAQGNAYQHVFIISGDYKLTLGSKVEFLYAIPTLQALYVGVGREVKSLTASLPLAIKPKSVEGTKVDKFPDLFKETPEGKVPTEGLVERNNSLLALLEGLRTKPTVGTEEGTVEIEEKPTVTPATPEKEAEMEEDNNEITKTTVEEKNEKTAKMDMAPVNESLIEEMLSEEFQRQSETIANPDADLNDLIIC